MPDDNTWSWDDYVRIATEISAKSPEGTFGSEDPTAPDTLDLFADSVVSLIPIFAIFLFGQKYLVRGVATTGLR